MQKETQGILNICLVSLLAFSLTSTSPLKAARVLAGWKTFTSRAGWTIKYPPRWRIVSCNDCTDPTDPSVFVNIVDPTNGMLMVQHLRDKPASQSVEEWLDSVSHEVANPHLSEQWILLDGRQALKIKTRNPDSTDSENIYVVDRSKTFFLQASPIGNLVFDQLYKQMLSTFRFTSH